MASDLASLISSAFGAVAKPNMSASAKAVLPADDQFARLLDSPAPRPETPAPANAAPTDDKPVENTPTAPKPEAAEAAEAAPAEATDDTEETEDTGDTSLADTLLAALAALGVNTDAVVTEDGELDLSDPAALNDIEGALNELAQMLGMDMTTLMQQLAQLAKDVSAEGGMANGADLAAKLSAWLGERLGAAGTALPAGAEESINKLLAGLKQLAKPLPTQPDLGTAELALPEPVIAAKTTEPSKAEASAPDIKVDANALQRSEGKKDADAADTDQKAQPNAHPAGRANANQDNTLNLVVAAQGQKADPTPTQVDATTSAPRVVQTGYQTSQQQLNLPQLAFEMSRQVQDGNTRFQIRLDPPELGRIDVKLEIDNRGQVHAKLTVEKSETLDLMQRDQRALEKALQQAGLDQSKTNLEFSLKQNPFAGDQNQRSGGGEAGPGSGQGESDEIEAPAPAITLYRGALQASGVNIIA